MQSIGTHGSEVMYFGCVCFRGELGFLNCDDICMRVVDKQLELLEFVFDSVYVDMQYDAISLTYTDGSMSLLRVCMLRKCEYASVTAVLVWEMDEVWLWWVEGMWVVHMGDARGSGIASSAADVAWLSMVPGMRGVGGVCEM